MDDKIIKNRSLLPLDLNIMLGLYKFNLGYCKQDILWTVAIILPLSVAVEKKLPL